MWGGGYLISLHLCYYLYLIGIGNHVSVCVCVCHSYTFQRVSGELVFNKSSLIEIVYESYNVAACTLCIKVCFC